MTHVLTLCSDQQHNGLKNIWRRINISIHLCSHKIFYEKFIFRMKQRKIFQEKNLLKHSSNQRLITKICKYATQLAEAGSEEKIKGQKNNNFKNLKNNIFLNVISLISDFLFGSCVSMLCSIIINFGNQPLVFSFWKWTSC